MKRALYLLGIVMVVGIMAIGCGKSDSATTTTSEAPTPEVSVTPPAGPTLVSQSACPVSGTPIDKTKFRDHEGQRVYFCCDNCPKAFEADPAKFIAEMKTEGIELEKAPG